MVEAIDPFDAESDVGARAIDRAPALLAFGKITDSFGSDSQSKPRDLVRLLLEKPPFLSECLEGVCREPRLR